MKHLVLLEAGPAHLAALLQWGREGLNMAEVTLVAPVERQACSAMVPGHLAGNFEVEDMMLPVAELARAAKVRWVAGVVSRLDVAERSIVLSDGRRLAYDALSIDTGGIQDRNLLPGAREHALWVRPIEPFLGFVDQMFGIARERELDVVVIGGGTTGVETALAIQCRLDSLRAGHGRSRVSLVAGVGGVLPLQGEVVRSHALKALARAKVVVVNEDAQAVSCDHVRLGNGARLACDAPVMCFGLGPAPWLQGSGLALDESGHVAVGPGWQSVSHPEVFAVGDLPSPPGVLLAHDDAAASGCGKPLAANLRAYLAGTVVVAQAPARRGPGFLLLGRRNALVHWGPYVTRGAWAWWWKRHVDKAFVKMFLRGATARR